MNVSKVNDSSWLFQAHFGERGMLESSGFQLPENSDEQCPIINDDYERARKIEEELSENGHLETAISRR